MADEENGSVTCKIKIQESDGKGKYTRKHAWRNTILCLSPVHQYSSLKGLLWKLPCLWKKVIHKANRPQLFSRTSLILVRGIVLVLGWVCIHGPRESQAFGDLHSCSFGCILLKRLWVLWGASSGAGPECVSGVKESQQQSKEHNLHFPGLLLYTNTWTHSYSGLLMLSLHQIQCEGSRESRFFCMYETLQRLSLDRQRVGKEAFYWWLDLSCFPVNAF